MAENGCTDSMLAIAKLHLTNCGFVEQDTNKALIFASKAVFSNNIEATLFVADLLAEGFTGADGVSIKRDMLTAHTLYLKASSYESRADIKLSALFLDKDFQELKGVDSDLANRFSMGHIEQAIAKGSVEAMYLQGMMYKEGKATVKNMGLAQYMLVKAAKLGHKAAEKELMDNLHIYR
jgi:TPR repeat protein